MWKEIAKHTWLLTMAVMLYFIMPVISDWINAKKEIEIARINASAVATMPDSTSGVVIKGGLGMRAYANNTTIKAGVPK